MEITTNQPLFTNLQSVIDCVDFATADEKYRVLVSASEADSWKLNENVSSYTGPEELSEIESQIFQIDASEVPALSWAYERYINLMGMVDAYFGEFVEEERRQYPVFYNEGKWCFGQAAAFMVTVCKLPQSHSMGWVCKIIAAEIRGGLYQPETAACS